MATPGLSPGLTATRRLIGQMLALMLVVGAMLIGVVLYSARTMDANAVTAQSELIDNSLSARLTRSLSELRSVAWWDEAVVKSRSSTFDKGWLDLEVGIFMTQSFRHDRIVIIDERDRPVYGFGANGEPGQAAMMHDLERIRPLIAQVRGGYDVSPRITDAVFTSDTLEASKFSNRRYGRGAAAIVQIDGKGQLVSMMAITPSVDMSLRSERPRILISFIKLDNVYWEEAGRDLLLGDLSYAMPGDLRRGTFQLHADDKSALGTLRWTPKRPGLLLLESVFPLILIGLAISTAVVSLLARRLFSTASTLEMREAAAQTLANHDALTGLPNRRMFQSELQGFADRVQHGQARLAIACIDIDRFKDINDTLGHPAGDQLICEVATRLKKAVPATDFVARLGGDEFAILRDCSDGKDVDGLLDLILSCFRDPFPIHGQLVEASGSTGLALSDPSRPFEDLMREADIALYEAKARGRNCGVRFEEPMARKIEQRRLIEVDLRKAIAQKDLTVVYQPIVEAITGQISSVEALVRWHSDTHGQVSPEIFIPIAEEAGMMAELGRLVIERAVSDSLRWPQLDTAINISAAQLRSTSILDDLIEPTERYGVDPRKITIEITESVLMSRDDHTMRMLMTLKERGFALALDDFGTGYSSLSYIRDFPFDRLKIDRSFVQGVEDSERALAIVGAIANFGRILGKDIVAEGIETEQEMQAMQRCGCTHLQGYLFARPLPAAHIEQMAQIGRLGVARSTGVVAKRAIPAHSRPKALPKVSEK